MGMFSANSDRDYAEECHGDEPAMSPIRPANRALDAAVRGQHDWDAYQVDRLLDYLMTMPRKVEAKKRIEALLHKARLDAIQCPDLILEMEVRKQLAAQDDPAAA